MLTRIFMLKRVQTLTLKCRDLYHGVGSNVDDGIGSVYGDEFQLEVENEFDSDNGLIFGEDDKYGADMRISDYLGWYVDRNVDAKIYRDIGSEVDSGVGIEI